MSQSRSRSRSRSRSPTRRRRLQSKRVVLINLPYQVSAGQLRRLFKEKLGYAGIIHLLEEHGRPAGIGFMDFKTFEGADEAIQKMTGVDVDGRPLLVREERPQDRERFERSRSSGAGSGPDAVSSTVLQQLGITGPLTNNVFVGNLDYKVTWQKLKDVFRLAGHVLKADVLEDREGKSKGVGMVKFETAFEAVQAISMFNGQALFARPMHVRLDFGPGRGGDAGPPRPPALPAGLGGIGMGLGVGGAPARSVEEVGMFSGASGYNDTYCEVYEQPVHDVFQQQQLQQPRGQLRSAVASSSFAGNSAFRHEFAVYVNNLPVSYGWPELKRAFREAGEVRFADILPDRRGIVKFATVSDAKRAVNLMDGARLDGRQIQVEME